MCEYFEFTADIDRDDMGKNVARYLFSQLISARDYLIEEDDPFPSKKVIKKRMKALHLLLTEYWPGLYKEMLEAEGMDI